MSFLTLSAIFIVLSAYFLFLGFKVFLTKKPFLISAKYNFLVIFISFAAQLVMPVGNVFRVLRRDDDGIDWFIVSMPLFLFVIYAVLLFYLWKTMRGYLIIGVNEDSLRSSLHDTLTKLGLPFEEQLSKIRLMSLNTDLQVSMNAWAGVASLKVKDAKYKETENEIVADLQKKLMDDNLPANLRTSYFYLFMGGFMLVFFAGLAYWDWANKF